MRAKIRQILEECIETGIESGYLRAHKQNDNPYAIQYYEQIENAIWLEIDRHFEFEQCASRNVCNEVVEGFDQLEKEREWVGLTQEELQDLCVKSYHTDNAGETHFNRGYFADAIEAKLKEKNR